MVESILAIVILLLVVSVLVYFYLREIKNIGRQTGWMEQVLAASEKQLDRIEKIVDSRDNLLRDIIEKKDAVHLKHVQILEKQVQPKPPVMDRVTEYVTSNVTPAPNEIEKTDDELKDDAFNEAFSKIPIDENTKVVIEEEHLPEEIIS